MQSSRARRDGMADMARAQSSAETSGPPCWRSPGNKHVHNSLEHSAAAQEDSNGDKRPGRNNSLYIGDFIFLDLASYNDGVHRPL
jgi:hypothetical protein